MEDFCGRVDFAVYKLFLHIDELVLVKSLSRLKMVVLYSKIVVFL